MTNEQLLAKSYLNAKEALTEYYTTGTRECIDKAYDELLSHFFTAHRMLREEERNANQA